MPFKTLSSGLTLQIPTPGTKNWAETLETSCWQKISEHDHTGSGKGKQIGTSAIANLAITGAKIALATITASQVADATLTSAKLAADAASRRVLLESFYSAGGGSSAITQIARALEGANVIDLTIPSAFRATYISINTASNLNSGNIVATLYKNGVTTGQSLTLTGSAGNTYGAIVPVDYAAGDELSVAITKNAAAFTTTAITIVSVFGHFTE